MIRPLVMGVVAGLCVASSASAYQVSRDLPYPSPGSWPAGYTRLDVYTPNGGIAPGAPTILDIHGGGYSGGDKRDDTGVCGRLADRGYNVISINYSLATQNMSSFPQAIRDVKAAMHWIRTTGVEFGLSPTIVVTATSAGATIALTAAYSEGVADFELLEPAVAGGYKVDAVVGLFGRYDLVWDATTNGTPQPMLVYLGGPITNPQFAPLFSAAAAVSYAGGCAPPTKLIHGSADAIVPYQHSVRLSSALSAAGVFNILEIIPGAGHGIGVLGDLNFVANEIASAIPQLLGSQPTDCQPGNPSPPPDNDSCSNAAALLAGSSVSGTTLSASGTRTTICGGGTDTRDVWYQFVPPLTRRYTFDTIVPNPAFNSSLSIYSSCATDSNIVGCDTESGGQWCAELRAVLNAGQLYLVRVAGTNGSAGPFTLHASAGELAADPPPNDYCSDPAIVGMGVSYSTTEGANGSLTACGENDHDDVWFRFTAAVDGVYRFDTEGSDLLPDTTLALRVSCEGPFVVCNNDATPGVLFARVEQFLYAGQSPIIRVAGNGGSGGPFRLNIERVPGTAEGACCMGPQCDIRIASDCGGGVWYEFLSCSAAPCAPPPAPGACCENSECEIVENAAMCAGTFRGEATVCGGPQNPTTCCRANINQVNGLTVQDIFDFLAAYFAAQPLGDFNLNGVVTVQDIFDFLSGYFAGCD